VQNSNLFELRKQLLNVRSQQHYNNLVAKMVTNAPPPLPLPLHQQSTQYKPKVKFLPLVVSHQDLSQQQKDVLFTTEENVCIYYNLQTFLS